MELAALLPEVEGPGPAVGEVVHRPQPGHGPGAGGGVGEDHEQRLVADRRRRRRRRSSRGGSRTWRSSKAGVLPSRAEYLGPRTLEAGLMPTPWYICWLSKKWRRAARCCFLLGAESGWPSLSIEVVLDVVADDERGDLAEFQPAHPAPAEEPVHGALVGLPRVRVADLRLEEVGVGVLGAGAGLADDRRVRRPRGGGVRGRRGRPARGPASGRRRSPAAPRSHLRSSSMHPPAPIRC